MKIFLIGLVVIAIVNILAVVISEGDAVTYWKVKSYGYLFSFAFVSGILYKKDK